MGDEQKGEVEEEWAIEGRRFGKKSIRDRTWLD